MKELDCVRGAFYTGVLICMMAAFLTPALAQTPHYVGTQQCTECHAEQGTAWESSHHALAWTPPSETHVLGNFDNTTFTHQGITHRFFKDEGQFFIETDGPDGTQTIYPVAGVAGVAPLQQYLVETEPGKLQSHDVVWDVNGKQWYHLYPDQTLKSDNGLHWTGPYKNWNARCAECHATGFEKNYDLSTKIYQSTQAEIGVGCEACHGPGEAHVAWATSKSAYDPNAWSGLGATGLTLDYSGEPELEIQQCAGCHARREPFADGSPLPGTPFHDAYRLSTLREGMYFPDGQILDEVYVYGSFLQSKMYQEGVSCSNCHDVHTAQLHSPGNATCTQCHSEAGNPDFPTLEQAAYDSAAHHFHPEGSAGAQCKSCHMPERVYMGVDWRRDHGFRVPRPDLSKKTGAPNVCTTCHSDQSNDWAMDELEARFPESRFRGQHFSQVFAGARRTQTDYTQDLIDIANHDALPSIIRATALDLMAQTPGSRVAQAAANHLDDADPLVRAAAIPALRGMGAALRADKLSPMLSDPIKSVRIAAAREIINLPREVQGLIDRNLAISASQDWQNSMRAKLDFPETHLVMGGISLTQRNLRPALAAFAEATALDPQLVAAWAVQARIYIAVQDIEAAKTVLEEALRHNPGNIELTLQKADLQ